MSIAEIHRLGLRPGRAGAVWFACCPLLLAQWFSVVQLHAITIEVRRMCDHIGVCAAGDFFSDHPQALDTLGFSTKAFEPFADNLLAIPSSPGWTATFTNPNTGKSASLINLFVPSDTLIIFAGGRDFDTDDTPAVNQVGAAGPGQANISLSRGQGVIVGSSAIDFSTWGGAIAFDTLSSGSPRNWHFDIHTPPAPGQTDFLTIALHELAHVFGFGTAPSFDNLVSGDQFQGANTINLTGSTVSLGPNEDHWASGTTSPPYADPPISALAAPLVLGRRRVLTPLDYAALADIGWEVPDKLLGLHGDIDADGDIDGRDFLIWQRSVGTSGVGLLADADGSQMVDEYDLWLWQSNYGRQVAGNQPLAAVPEPATIMSTGMVAMALLACRILK